MVKRKPKPNSTALAVLFPKPINDKEIKTVIKKASFDDLHSTYTQMATMFQLVDESMRDEIIKRLSRMKDQQVETQLGYLKLKERSNYDFDIDGIDNFFKNKKVDISDLYKIDYNVVTTNKKAIKIMLDKGWITEAKKVNTEVFAKLLSKYKSLRKFVEQKVTTYITGL